MTHKELRLDMPATYQIRVQGYLPESWSDRLGGMMVIPSGQAADEAPETTLTGCLLDQAALFGVLNALYDLHLPLLSVECQSYESSRDLIG